MGTLHFRIALFALPFLPTAWATVQPCGTHPSDEDVLAAEAHFLENKVSVSGSGAKAVPHLEDALSLNVYWHVIYASENFEDGFLPQEQIEAAITTLNSYFIPFPFTWNLVATTRTLNATWFHNATIGTVEQTEMKAALRQGGAADYNVYTVGFTTFPGLLGYSTFPWLYSSAPQDDGIVMYFDTLPGGTSGNDANTLAHEAGQDINSGHARDILIPVLFAASPLRTTMKLVPLFIFGFPAVVLGAVIPLFENGIRIGDAYTDTQVIESNQKDIENGQMDAMATEYGFIGMGRNSKHPQAADLLLQKRLVDGQKSTTVAYAEPNDKKREVAVNFEIDEDQRSPKVDDSDAPVLVHNKLSIWSKAPELAVKRHEGQGSTAVTYAQADDRAFEKRAANPKRRTDGQKSTTVTYPDAQKRDRERRVPPVGLKPVTVDYADADEPVPRKRREALAYPLEDPEGVRGIAVDYTNADENPRRKRGAKAFIADLELRVPPVGLNPNTVDYADADDPIDPRKKREVNFGLAK
ncbi:hypothetical protein DL96DRAFT_1810815 [Flagelloscypha sp. PMI_526]|nr:hypothetical protein DL96DRAFT_1810815 [Flagelloscypha sp. PMI_526]